MNYDRMIYDLLQAACHMLERSNDLVSAAHVSLVMARVSERARYGRDHLAGGDAFSDESRN